MEQIGAITAGIIGLAALLTALGVGARTIGGKTYVAIGFELTNTAAQ